MGTDSFIVHVKTTMKIKKKKHLKDLKVEHHVFTEEINKIALSSDDDKRIQSINSIETYAYGMSKDLVCKKEKIKQLSLIKTMPECLNLIMLQTKT